MDTETTQTRQLIGDTYHWVSTDGTVGEPCNLNQATETTYDDADVINARNFTLCEAAPDLLAALEAGVENDIPMTEWLGMARAAIAKAKGAK